MTEENMDGRDFRNCGWAVPVKNVELAWDCKRKKMRFLIRDLEIGICPCRYWVHRGKIAKKAEKTSSGEPGKSLF